MQPRCCGQVRIQLVLQGLRAEPLEASLPSSNAPVHLLEKYFSTNEDHQPGHQLRCPFPSQHAGLKQFAGDALLCNTCVNGLARTSSSSDNYSACEHRKQELAAGFTSAAVAKSLLDSHPRSKVKLSMLTYALELHRFIMGTEDCCFSPKFSSCQHH